MTHRKLEERVSELERLVAELQKGLANGTRKKDWRRTIGMFSGEEGVPQLFEEAMKIREADRAKARRKYGKRQRTQS